MDPVRNPFAPGAGSQPPQLAGRDAILSEARIALQRVLMGRHERSQILLGLRGTGKTVLLNKIESIARELGCLTSFVEAPEDRNLAEMLYPKLHQVLRQLSAVEQAKAQVHSALRALRAFASAFRITVKDVSISVDPEPGAADSGVLEFDLGDLFVRVGEAARAAGKAWGLFIDEIQYLGEEELSALIVAVHRVNQMNLPITLFGAGLPQVAALSGGAKSYAERLFSYPTLGALDRAAAFEAVRRPILDEGESITEEALDYIFEKTQGYPYFLQEWGYQTWNVADGSPVDIGDARRASVRALERLDEGFFRVRLERLTPREREYVFAMASLGTGPYRSADVAALLGVPMQKLGPIRARIIAKGMIYSPGHGDIAFTVPMFEEFVNRTAVPPGESDDAK